MLSPDYDPKKAAPVFGSDSASVRGDLQRLYDARRRDRAEVRNPGGFHRQQWRCPVNTTDPLATQIAEGFILWIFGGVTQPLVIPQSEPLHLAIRKDAIPFSKRFIAHLYSVKGDPEYIWSGAITPSEEYLESALFRQLANAIQPWLVRADSPYAPNQLSAIVRDCFGQSSNISQIKFYASRGKLPSKQLPLKTLLEAAIRSDLTIKGDLTEVGEAIRSLSRSLRTPAPGFGSSEGFQSVFQIP
jgi:hypothetical protein